MDKKVYSRFKFINKHWSVLNPHAWIIAAMILGLTYLYYSNLSMIAQSFPKWYWIWELMVFEFNYSLNGSLFCIPFFYAAYIFGWQGILTAWLLVMALNLPRILYLSFSVNSFITNLVFLMIPLLIVIIFTLIMKRRQASRKIAAEIERRRKTYLAMILKAQEDERKRISREIHDDTIQRLWLVYNQVQSLMNDQPCLLPDNLVSILSRLNK